MTKYQVNGGDKSERGDEAISPEAKQKPARNKGKHIEGHRTETSGSARECNWVVGSQILTARLDSMVDRLCFCTQAEVTSQVVGSDLSN